MTRSSFSRAVGLGLLAFVVYNSNLRSITSFDTNPTRYLPISIIKERNFDLDEFPFLQKYPDWWHRDKQGTPYYLQYVRGRYMSSYPVMPAVLSVPVYAIPVLLGLTDGPSSAMGFTRTEIVGTFLSKVTASAAVAFSVSILYLTLLRMTSRRASLWIALLYAFATSSWSLSSQGLWQTSMSQPLLAFSLYFFVRGREDGRYINVAGIPLALSVACRPTNIILAVALLIYVARYHRANIRHFVIVPFVVGAFVLTYNLYYFGSVTGPYSIMMGKFTYPRFEGFLGLLISPSRGILVYSPILLFGFVGMVLTFYCRRDPLLQFSGIAAILLILLYSAWSEWHAAFSYSYRFLVDLLPVLSMFFAIAWSWIVAKWWRKSLFVTLAVYSVFIQIIGSFYYPCGWYETPVRAGSHPERFWDWQDPEFLRCLRAGPVNPEGLRFLKEITQR